MPAKILLLFLALTAIKINTAIAYSNNSNAIYTWEGGRIEWPCPTTKRLIKAAAKYTPRDIIATRCQRVEGKTVCAFPRYKNIIPITLSQIYATKKGCDVKFEPFPCWTEQEEGNCDALQSVIDIFSVGEFVWVLDSGIIQTLRTPIQRCSPKIVVYQGKTGTKLKTISLERFVTEKSRLQYLQVECLKGGHCYVYISDPGNNVIIVYDVYGGRGYRIILPKAVHHGCRIRDVLYIFLIHQKEGTQLYFSYLCGQRLFAIRTEHLRKGQGGSIIDIGEKPNVPIFVGTDAGSGVFFREEGDSDVYYWNTNQCYKKSNFKMVHKSVGGLYATHVFPDFKINRLLILENDFPSYVKDFAGCGTLHQISILDGTYTCE
ncbi:uncharacterized protein LOC131434153 [Malaya genurostris]|uniref:uncharacterized protein LOC131434153 n=1 Tax=Malaya genurostris TaxID=325434 RepID=UPI0026F3A845|nr:uncharacterized protein LOC131434153 [Malaya genurostris]